MGALADFFRMLWALFMRLFSLGPLPPAPPAPEPAPLPIPDPPTTPTPVTPTTIDNPPIPVLSRNLSNAFFRGLVDLAVTWKTDPAFLLAVSAYEAGGVNPAASNPAGAYGLFQWTEASRGVIGWVGPMSGIAKLPSEEQLPLIAKYFGRGAPYKSIGEVYGETFVPARMAERGRAPATVLTQAGEAFYDENKSLDANHDGKITIADLQETATRATENMGLRWKEIMARLSWFEAHTGNGTPGVSIAPLVAVALALGIGVALAHKS